MIAFNRVVEDFLPWLDWPWLCWRPWNFPSCWACWAGGWTPWALTWHYAFLDQIEGEILEPQVFECWSCDVGCAGFEPWQWSLSRVENWDKCFSSSRYESWRWTDEENGKVLGFLYLFYRCLGIFWRKWMSEIVYTLLWWIWTINEMEKNQNLTYCPFSCNTYSC